MQGRALPSHLLSLPDSQLREQSGYHHPTPPGWQGSFTLSFEKFVDPRAIPYFVLLVMSLSLQILASLSSLPPLFSLQSIFQHSIQSFFSLLKIWSSRGLPFCLVGWSQASISHDPVLPHLDVATNIGLTASNCLLISSQKLPQFTFFAPVLYSDPYSFSAYMNFRLLSSRKKLNQRHLQNQGLHQLLTVCQTSKPANHSWIHVVTTVLCANAEFFRQSANV